MTTQNLRQNYLDTTTGEQPMTTASAIQATTAQAYKLQHSLVYPNSDFDYEAWIVEFPGWEKVKSGFWSPQPVTFDGTEGFISFEQQADGFWYINQFKLPKLIKFETVGDIINYTDYPDCKPNWPIMSKKMLDTLLSVREFPYQAVPVMMIDTQKYYDETVGDYIAPEKKIHDFVAVQLLEHQDIFDWEHSVYETDPEMPGEINSVDQLVLREPESGLPPIFRLKTLSSLLYVSVEGRAALESAGIRGIKFLDLV
jgi:hypothetical protein